jgi:hypothetical protein
MVISLATTLDIRFRNFILSEYCAGVNPLFNIERETS